MSVRHLPLFALAFTLASFSADAHDAVTEGGPFVNGLLHPVIEPAHLLSLLALGLWVGVQERDALRRTVVAFAVALIAGLIAGPLATLPAAVPLALALALGCLAAAGWRMPARATAMIALAAAATVGFDSASDTWMLSVGIWAGAMLTLLNIVNLVMRIRVGWMRIAVRIAGAWIAAIALLLLAFSLRA